MCTWPDVDMILTWSSTTKTNNKKNKNCLCENILLQKNIKMLINSYESNWLRCVFSYCKTNFWNFFFFSFSEFLVLKFCLAVSPSQVWEACSVLRSSRSWAEGFPPELQLLTHLGTVLITNHLYMQLLTGAHNKALIHIICWERCLRQHRVNIIATTAERCTDKINNWWRVQDEIDVKRNKSFCQSVMKNKMFKCRLWTEKWKICVHKSSDCGSSF